MGYVAKYNVYCIVVVVDDEVSTVIILNVSDISGIVGILGILVGFFLFLGLFLGLFFFLYFFLGLLGHDNGIVGFDFNAESVELKLVIDVGNNLLSEGESLNELCKSKISDLVSLLGGFESLRVNVVESLKELSGVNACELSSVVVFLSNCGILESLVDVICLSIEGLEPSSPISYIGILIKLNTHFYGP